MPELIFCLTWVGIYFRLVRNGNGPWGLYAFCTTTFSRTEPTGHKDAGAMRPQSYLKWWVGQDSNLDLQAFNPAVVSVTLPSHSWRSRAWTCISGRTRDPLYLLKLSSINLRALCASIHLRTRRVSKCTAAHSTGLLCKLHTNTDALGAHSGLQRRETGFGPINVRSTDARTHRRRLLSQSIPPVIRGVSHLGLPKHSHRILEAVSASIYSFSTDTLTLLWIVFCTTKWSPALVRIDREPLFHSFAH